MFTLVASAVYMLFIINEQVTMNKNYYNNIAEIFNVIHLITTILYANKKIGLKPILRNIHNILHM